ncbi:MAG: helix-turn-helix transcriptional regulator [SAR202 cluster bacterium]|nr:helix-turn-helix transcriptional regulator [SAR202 cluster bacterium]
MQTLWYAQGDVNQTREKVLPNGVVEWIFNINTGPHLVVQANGRPVRQLYRDSWIAGMQDMPLVIQSLAETELFGIRFRPGGVLPFLRAPLGEFTNAVFEFDLVLGAEARRVRERLVEAANGGLPDQFAALESFLLSRIDEDLLDPLVEYAASRLTDARPPRVEPLADECGLSHKQFVARFHRAVGVPPKTLQRIARFQRTVHALASRRTPDLSGIGYEAGYSDQAHFNRDFKSLSGVSPKAYLRTRTFDESHLIVD